MVLPIEGTLIAETASGDDIELPPGQGQRVLYALTTLAQAPVAPHVTIRSLRTPEAEELWRSVAGGQR